MRYHALACDYDGTLATRGVLRPGTAEALRAVRASGRKVLMVTGRQLDDLKSVCPQLDLFDLIVAENGALLYTPQTGEARPLAEAPPPAFVQALTARGVGPIAVGHVIVATWEPHQAAVLEVIRELGLELQVIFNKGAVMVLPSGVNKATGLDAALAELALSRHNVVAVGDAENDHAFLARSECGVAVANALPMLKERADLVTVADHGEGVAELCHRILETDLAELAPALVRHDIPLAEAAGGAPGSPAGVALPAYGGGLLVTGLSGSGKSAIVAGLLERMAERGYQFCVVDPEGDYAGVEGAVMLGDAKRPPTAGEVLEVLAHPDRNVVVNLLGLPVDGRPRLFAELLPRLADLRARQGRPHWIVVDEAHHVLPEAGGAPALEGRGDPRGLLLVTVHPQHVARAALRAVDAVLAVGADAGAALRAFAAARGDTPPAAAVGSPGAGEALLWRPGRPDTPSRVRPLPGRAERKRHALKYAESELGPDDSFYFRGPGDRLNLRAQNLRMFLQVADGVDVETWLYHLRQGHYSRWVRDAVRDAALADEIAAVEARPAAGPPPDVAAATRAAVRAAVEARYTAPA